MADVRAAQANPAELSPAELSPAELSPAELTGPGVRTAAPAARACARERRRPGA
jgi:hypothetical protein